MSERIEHLQKLLGRRIAVLDGILGRPHPARDPGRGGLSGRALPRPSARRRRRPDLLNITRPEVVLGIHRDYFAAGADMRDPGYLRRPRSGKRTTRSDAAYEMSVAGARLAREAAGRSDRPAWVAGSIGPLGVSLSVSPRRRRSDLSLAYLRPDRRRVRAADPRARRGRRRPAADRDDLRHAEREAAVAAALDVAPEVPRWTFTAIDRADRPSPARRSRRSGRRSSTPSRSSSASTARAQRDRDAAVRRGPPRGSPTRSSPAIRTPGCRTRWGFTTNGRPRARSCASSPRDWPRERRRRVLRNDARARAGDRRHDRRAPRPRAAAARHQPLQRHGAVRDRPGHRLRDGRRAHERHRRRPLPAGWSRPTTGPARSRSPWSRCAAARTCST